MQIGYGKYRVAVCLVLTGLTLDSLQINWLLKTDGLNLKMILALNF